MAGGFIKHFAKINPLAFYPPHKLNQLRRPPGNIIPAHDSFASIFQQELNLRHIPSAVDNILNPLSAYRTLPRHPHHINNPWSFYHVFNIMPHGVKVEHREHANLLNTVQRTALADLKCGPSGSTLDSAHVLPRGPHHQYG